MIQQIVIQDEVRIALQNGVFLVGQQQQQIKGGEYYYVFPDGTKQYAGLYVNDQKQGIWQDYKGDQLFPSIYEKGIRNPFLGNIDQQGNKQGFWTEIEGDDDQLIYQGDYKDNIRVGTWNLYLHGELVGKGSYNEHGIKVGEWIEAGEQIFAKNDYSPLINRKCFTYLGQYKNGKKQGYWSINDEGEQIGGGNYNEDGMKEGDWTEIYENLDQLNRQIRVIKIIKQKGSYRNGLPIGEWKIIYQNSVIGGGNYIEQGLKHGKWTEFYIQRQGSNISFQGEYNHGLRIGEWQIKFDVDQSFVTCNYNSQGQKQGYWIEADTTNDELIKYAGVYNNDLRIGEWQALLHEDAIGGGIYDQNGLKQDEWIEIKNLSGTYYGRYKNGMRIGEWKIKLYGEIIGGGNYDEQGVKQDQWIEYNFEKMSFEQGIYKNGIRQGKWKIKIKRSNTNKYAPKNFECYYDQRGIKQGKWTEISKIYSNNLLIENGTYVNGIKTGKWQGENQECILIDGEYDQNGVKQGLWIDPYYFFETETLQKKNKPPIFSFGQYMNGLRVGEWKILDQSGIMGSLKFDEKGVLNGEVTYDIRRETMQCSYENGFLKKIQIINKLAFNLKTAGCFNSRNQKDGKIQLSGQYNDGKKIDCWILTDDYKKNIGFGNYDQNGLKQGQWIEPPYDVDFHLMILADKIIFHRQYQDEILVGNCQIMFCGYQIGGGNYDSNGNKQGIWKEPDSRYNYSRQIIFQGEYKDNVRVGQWIILFKKRKIGGGTYDEKGLKQGQWHEVDTKFDNWTKINKKGEYKNGKKVGQWIVEKIGGMILFFQYDNEGNLLNE